ncbi:MAG: hypothetical protein JOS17DRAFT_742482 [Linnemannia elongata]|nr:MAG: hypothetical protein JOS17DRAFT_742482 [Linnemannia elongata]
MVKGTLSFSLLRLVSFIVQGRQKITKCTHIYRLAWQGKGNKQKKGRPFQSVLTVFFSLANKQQPSKKALKVFISHLVCESPFFVDGLVLVVR